MPGMSRTAGNEVSVLTIGAPPGPVVEVLTLGATVHRLDVACGDGVRRNVVLGHPDTAERLASGDYVGGTIGRYANRIAAGRFELDGLEVNVGAHDRGNSLHGGPDGFDRRVWDVVEHGQDELVLSLVSPDGDQGFPGTVSARVRYRVADERVLVVMEATTDSATVVNLTNHAYFNLDGEGAGTIDDHLLTVPAELYTPVDATGIPLGEHSPVAGTPFDFRTAAQIGPTLRREHPQVVESRGIDHNYVIDGDGAADGRRPRVAAHPHPAQRPVGPARAAGLHRQLLRRHPTVHERRPLPPGRRHRPGAPAVPGLAEPARVAVSDPATRRDVPVGAGVGARHRALAGAVAPTTFSCYRSQ